MIAIYKKELKSFFNSMMGYVVLFFFVLIVGIYFWGVNLQGQNGFIGDTLSNILMTYTIVIPLLTMRLFAEEKKMKTDQLLFSSPVTIWDVILGKYFAVVTFFSLPFVLICTMPFVLNQYGNVIMIKSFVSILMFWLLGCVLLSIGLLASTVTENQLIAAIIAFGVNIGMLVMGSVASSVPSTAIVSLIALSILYFIVVLIVFGFIRNIIVSGLLFIAGEGAMVAAYFIKSSLFESAFSKVLSGVSFFSRYNELVGNVYSLSKGGSLNLGTIVYYVSFIALFLYCAMQVIQKRRWN